MLRFCYFFPWMSASNTCWLSFSAEALIDFPVCIVLINFRSTHLISCELSIVFSHNASILLFPLFSGLSHSLLPFPCIATFPWILVTITGVNDPYRCLSSPTLTFDCLAAFSGQLLPLRVFLSCDKRDCLLIFPTVIKRTFVKTSRFSR
jgi:hypothetical protein